MTYEYVIVGGGLTAASAVEGIRSVDSTGRILMLSRENHPPYHRPPLSKDLWFGKKTKDGAEYVGEKTKDGAVKTADEVTDAWLITKLNGDFVNEATLKGSSINVDSDNQVVTLKGTVMSEAGRQRAMEIAKTTKGVKRVNNNLVIAPK